MILVGRERERTFSEHQIQYEQPESLIRRRFPRQHPLGETIEISFSRRGLKVTAFEGSDPRPLSLNLSFALQPAPGPPVEICRGNNPKDMHFSQI